MRLLDLFCGAGGCSVGYSRAGFTEIVGVDNRPMPRYPFAFVQADAAKAEWGPALGIDWMNWQELSQAIPPAYTEFIGRQLLAAIESKVTG